MHHSTKRVDELVTSIHSTLRPAPDGSQQDLAPTGERAQGSISPFGSKENKDGTQQQGTAAASATPAEGKPAAKAPKGSKAPISRPLLRTFIIKHAEQKGPEGATKLAWVMSPELAAKYQLPADLPEAVALELAASVKAPKKRPNAEAQPVLSPASGQKKSKTAPESAKASATTGPSTATGEGKTDDSAVLTPVTAKPLHEVEKQYAEGTVKRYIVEVLKAVRPQGLSVQQVMDKGKELSIKEFEPKHRNQISQALIMDPNFCRLEKGLYSLHAFHPDVKVFAKPPAPRKRPAEDGAAGDWSKLQRVTSEGEVPAAGAKERGMEGGGDQEVDDLAQAEKVLRNAKAALARHQAALDRAATSHEEAKAAFEESKKSSKAPSKQARRNSDFHSECHSPFSAHCCSGGLSCTFQSGPPRQLAFLRLYWH